MWGEKMKQVNSFSKLWSWIYYLGAQQLSNYAFYIIPPLSVPHSVFPSITETAYHATLSRWNSAGGDKGKIYLEAFYFCFTLSPPPLWGGHQGQTEQSEQRQKCCVPHVATFPWQQDQFSLFSPDESPSPQPPLCPLFISCPHSLSMEDSCTHKII